MQLWSNKYTKAKTLRIDNARTWTESAEDDGRVARRKKISIIRFWNMVTQRAELCLHFLIFLQVYLFFSGSEWTWHQLRGDVKRQTPFSRLSLLNMAETRNISKCQCLQSTSSRHEFMLWLSLSLLAISRPHLTVRNPNPTGLSILLLESTTRLLLFCCHVLRSAIHVLFQPIFCRKVSPLISTFF